MFNYLVNCPSNPIENRTFQTLDECWDLCLSLSDEFGYAEVTYGACFMGSYGTPT